VQAQKWQGRKEGSDHQTDREKKFPTRTDDLTKRKKKPKRTKKAHYSRPPKKLRKGGLKLGRVNYKGGLSRSISALTIEERPRKTGREDELEGKRTEPLMES